MFILLVVLILIYNFSFSFLQLSGADPSALGELLYNALFICAAGWWLKSEMHKHRLQPLYCNGLMLQAGWLIVMPYYMFKTRGIKGLIPLAIVFGAFVLAQFLAVVVHMFTTYPNWTS